MPSTSSLRFGIRTSSIQRDMLSTTHWAEEKHNTPEGGAKRHSHTVMLQEGVVSIRFGMGMEPDHRGIGIPTSAHYEEQPTTTTTS
eukprot:568979-Amphidinium_carterae.3